MLFITFFLFYFFSIPYPIFRIAQQREFSYTTVSNMSLDTSKPIFIIALGSGKNDDIRLVENQRLSSEALSRLIEAIKWFKKLPRATLVCSGPIGIGDKSQATLMKETAVALGVDEVHIHSLEHVTNTKTEAEQFIKNHNPDAQLILCTSALHMPRAVRWFKHYGVQNIYPAPSSFTAPDQPMHWNHWLPSLRSFEKWQRYFKEVVGEFFVPVK